MQWLSPERAWKVYLVAGVLLLILVAAQILLGAVQYSLLSSELSFSNFPWALIFGCLHLPAVGALFFTAWLLHGEDTTDEDYTEE